MRFVALALLLVASSGCAALGAPQAQQSGPIKLGMVTSLTGNYAPLGTNDRLGVQQVIDATNAKGGITGRRMEIDMLDDASDPNQSVVQFNKVADGGVVAVLGPPQSTADLALRPLANEKKIPIVSLGASDEQVIPPTPYMWQVAPLSSQVATVCLGYIKQQGKSRLAMLYDTKNAYAVFGHDASVKLLGQYGLTLVDDETFELGQTNFAPQFSKIADAKPDFLLVWATGAPPVIITKQWADAHNGIPLMMTAAEASPLYIQPAGEAAEGVYVQASMGAIGKTLPSSNKYKKLTDDFAGPFEQANKYYPPQFAWDGMIGMTFLLDAISRKGADREAIRAGLDSINLDTPEGHYTYSPEKH